MTLNEILLSSGIAVAVFGGGLWLTGFFMPEKKKADKGGRTWPTT